MVTISDFNAFLKNIEPSKSQKEYYSSIQRNIRSFLENHDVFKVKYLDSFISGSHIKNTAINNKGTSKKSDIDIIIVTTYGLNDSSIAVIDELYFIFKKSLKYDNVTKQRRSIKVEMSGVFIDIVPVILDVNDDGYYIGNSKTNEWVRTNPKCHIEWSSSINKKYPYYKKIIKILKKWNLVNSVSSVKYPKGIALEVLVSKTIVDSDDLIFTLSQTIINIITYIEKYTNIGVKPLLIDPCMEDNDLFEDYSLDDLKKYINILKKQKEYLEKEESSNNIWRTILGSNFPLCKTKPSYEEFIENEFPINFEEKYKLIIDCKVTQDGWRPNLLSEILKINGFLQLKKRLEFFICNSNVHSPYDIVWKVRNIGKYEPKKLRGQLIRNQGKSLIESTDFSGPHFVECYIIKDKECVAKTRIDVPIKSNLSEMYE